MTSEQQKALSNPRVTWWNDVRFQRERKILLISSIGIAGVIMFIWLLILSTAKSPDEPQVSKSMALPAKATKEEPVTVQVEKQKPSELEEAAQCILGGQLGAASVKLLELENQLYRLQGIIAWKQGDILKAEALFEKALNIAPSSAPDLVNLAGIKLLQGNGKAAVSLLQKARDAAPSDPYIANRYLLAKIEAGDIEAAKREISTTLETSPENGSAQVVMAAAAIELSGGHTANAKNFLNVGKSKLDRGVFLSLLAERPIAIYSTIPELKEFFDQKQ